VEEPIPEHVQLDVGDGSGWKVSADHMVPLQNLVEHNPKIPKAQGLCSLCWHSPCAGLSQFIQF
jgi:hypothetical protein